MEKYEALSDGTLVERTLAGDADAYGQLVVRTKNLVFGVIRRIVSDPYAAEDVAQDSYTDGFLQLSRLEAPEKFAPWICGIAKRKALRHVTRQRKAADVDALSEVLVTDAATPEEALLAKERTLAIRCAVGRLSKKNREVAVRHYYGGQSVADIAAALSLPVGSVKSRLYEARRKLKGELSYMKEETIHISPDFERKITEKIRRLQAYYRDGGPDSAEAEALYRSVETELSALPESDRKQYLFADLYAQKYREHRDDKSLETRLRAAADAGANGAVQTDLFVEGLNLENGPETIRRIDAEGIPMLEKIGYSAGIGQLRFWRGYGLLQQKQTEEAFADFAAAERLCPPEDVIRAAAVSARVLREKLRENAEDPEDFQQVSAVSCAWDGTKLRFTGEPGFSLSRNRPLWEKHGHADSLFFTVTGGEFFFDAAMEQVASVPLPGNGACTLVGAAETVCVPAGTFENCIHLHFAGEHWDEFHVWYAPNVGLVKAVFPDGEDEIYELAEYAVKGGAPDDYLPLAVGNYWRYHNPALPENLYQYIGYDVVYADGKTATLAEYGLVTYKKDPLEAFGQDSNVYLDLCAKACEEWKIGEAIGHLQNAVRVNSGETAAAAALGGIAYLRRMEEYQKKGYRFCPSSYNGSYLIAKHGAVYYHEAEFCSFGPYRYGDRDAENRIFGVKSFRYLERLVGKVWDEKWVPGYTDVIRRDPGESSRWETRLSVSEGGTVTVKAGTFENCIKVTLERDLPKGETDHFRGFRFTHCGKKEFWYAPGVGIVRFDYTWGERLSASSELVSYANPAGDTSFFPLTLGCAWEYEERNLTAEGYAAKRSIQIPCGMDGKYFAHDVQEFVYLGTEDEYEAMKAGK